MGIVRSSFAGFTTAQLGMSASQSALNVAGQNISNINTKGYTRQRVDLNSFNSTTGPRQWGSVNDTFIGNGVVVNRVEQVRDPYLDLRFRTEMSSVGYYDKTLAALEDLEAVIDEVDKDGSIHNQLEAVFKALNEFNPQAANNEFQNMAKTEMQLLTQYFNNYSNRIQQTKEENMTLFKDQTIPQLNKLLKDITRLNDSIKENELMGNPALELRDERNLLLDELSDYVKIEVTYEKKNVGLSSREVEECTVKMLGVDDKGNFYKYTIVDHDKASTFSINDDCSNLTMTDVNGVPLADIGSALKPTDNKVGNFTDTEAQAINKILENIQKFSNDVDKYMRAMDATYKEISKYGSQINNLSKKGSDLQKELKTTLISAKSVDASVVRLQEELDAIIAKYPNPTEEQQKEIAAAQKKVDDKKNVQKIYNQRLYGTDEKPTPLDEDGNVTAAAVNAAYAALNVPADAKLKDVEGIYNKLIKIYGNIDDISTQPPTHVRNDADTDFATGDLHNARENLKAAQEQLLKDRENYTNAIANLKKAIEGDKTKNPDGTITINEKGLEDYANITVKWDTYPVDGTTYFISLPTITLAGTSARDGNGIPLFDPNMITKDAANAPQIGEIAKFAVAGDTITITDTRKVTYTEETKNVDGTPYEYTTEADGKTIKEIAKDDQGRYIPDMGDLKKMYDYMQEDAGSIKASLDMFNRAGEFDGTTDRGYDYYINMLDVFARQIAKVFNEANTKDVNGNPLLDSNGKPIDYANALLGADGKIPVKNVNITNADGKYLVYNGTNFVPSTTGEPIPDVFKTNNAGELLDKDGNVIKYDGSDTPVTLGTFQVADDGTTLIDKNGNTLKDDKGNAITKEKLEKALENAVFDESALAAYGIVRSQEAAYTDKDLNNNAATVNPGDWINKDGNKLISGTNNDINATAVKQDILKKIADGSLKPLEGKVPKFDYDQITASNFTITKDWADAKTNFVQTHDPSQTAGYNDNINHLISQFGVKQSYTMTQPDGSQKSVFNGTFVEFYDNVGNQLGLDIKSSTILVNNYITITNDIANNRDAVSGVSLDEEGIDMLKYQKSYTAAARLMTALDEMLDKVINGMGIVGR